MKRIQTKRIDADKVYAFIGRAVVYVAGCIIGGYCCYWAFLQNTIY